MNEESRAHGPASLVATTTSTIPLYVPDADTLTAAMEYAIAGLPVFPLRPGLKEPATSHGFHDATCLVSKILEWRDRDSHYNIGCPPPSGMVVVDVDVQHGGDIEFEKLIKQQGRLPRTWIVQTGGGGRHYWFTTTVTNFRATLCKGVDLKHGAAGYVVMPPSIHPNGQMYQWITREGSSPAPAPKWLEHLMQKPAPAEPKKTSGQRITASIALGENPAWVNAGIEKVLEEMRTCPEGGGDTRFKGRDDACFQTSMRMAEFSKAGYITEIEARQAVLDAARQTGLADTVIEGKLDRAFSNAEPAEVPPPAAGGPANTLTDQNGDPIVDTNHHTDTDSHDEIIRTVPWPVLNPAALHGIAGDIVKDVAPHTEADPAALLVQLLAVFGAMVGREPHIRVGNEEHPPILHPVIVGRTANGAKGTSTGVIKAIAKIPASEFFTKNTASGLSSDAGLIERVSDPLMDIDKSGEPVVVNPGTLDKRLLVIETEYGSVLARGRRENNPLAQVIRQAWDGDDLRTLNRKANSLNATRPHIVIIGHITPGEFRSTLRATDFSGGSVNRLLICMSRRSKLHTRLGNVPSDALQAAADKFGRALRSTDERGELKFTDQFWSRWDQVYPELVRDRPDSAAAAASGRAVPMVLRLAMIYTLINGAEKIDAEHLEAALGLWEYCDHSVRWLFSTYEQDEKRVAGDDLANFIRTGGTAGRTRTQISVDFYKRHKAAADIAAELAPLIHEGIVIEEVSTGSGTRPVRRYVHRSVR